jgi:predicted signal transduction protein with EAL and GGDEF domain
MIPVIWVALRQNLLAASLGILVTNSLVAIGARASLGATDDLVAVQTLMLAAALAALYAGAVRRTEGARLAETVDSQARYRTLVENSPALVTRFGTDGGVLLQAGRIDDEVAIDDVSEGLRDRWEELRQVLTSAEIADVEWSLGTDEAERWLETRAVIEPAADGTAASLLTVTSDRTAVRRAAEDLARAARRDVVTGLPNRTAAHEWLEAATGDRHGEADAGAPAVLAVLLDDAPTLTAGVGRAVVDQLAVAMADRLQTIDEQVRVARVGRTRFVLVTTAPDDVAHLAGAALDAFLAPIELDAQSTRVRVSVGTHVPDDEHPIGRLELAELAGRFAQDAGGGRVVHFTRSMVDAAADTRAVVHGLRHGIERGELVVHYQPVVTLADGRVVGAEALVRWQRPGHGLVGPVDFIEIAEQSGLIDDIGAAVERITTTDLLAHPGLLPPGFALNLNVSAPQLTSATFAARMAGVVSSCTSS